MTGLYAPDGGVNRLPKKWIAPVGGVNWELKELYASVGGVNRKIFSSLSVGDTYTFSERNWIVLNIDDTTGQAILMYNDVSLGTKAFNADSGHSTSTYRWSAIRDYLTSTYYDTFSTAEKEQIVARQTPYMFRNSSGKRELEPGPLDKVWLLSAGEIYGQVTIDYTEVLDGSQLQLFAINNTDSARVSLFGAKRHWTRSGTGSNANNAIFVEDTGKARASEPTTTAFSFRPCILINP